MTVSELIVRLQDLDPNAEVVGTEPSDGNGPAEIVPLEVNRIQNGQIVFGFCGAIDSNE